MRYFPVVLLIVLVFSCQGKPKPKKHLPDPRAVKLNDSALVLTRSTDTLDLKKAVILYDEALQIDPGFFAASWNKFSCLESLGMHKEAISTGMRMLSRDPSNPDLQFMIGTAFDMDLDSVSAFKYYDRANALYDSLLLTMDKRGKGFSNALMNKAVTLIYQGKKEGYVLLKQLYDQEKDPNVREMLEQAMTISRREFLNSITAAQH